ncbi:bifunctional DNA primase/polymerase [Kocuria rosea]|uniref:bifunctional DNA primase/polymerase n=1 Tax=Kocuria rosea TaxID=1275 RepID=UPI0011A7A31E|nr:bifunctional DNA primase/polymerase [Kocuria rosea]
MVKISDHVRDRPTTCATNTTLLGDLALDYVAKGYTVFPLQPGRKDPFPGSHGFKDATKDPEQVKRWWRATPDANIGIATGASDLVVVDLDVKHAADGLRSWHDRTVDLDLPEPVVVHTPSGGLHLYYQTDPGADRIGISADKDSGIDVRADGGYVVAPGSYTTGDGNAAEGFYYLDMGEGGFDSGEVADLPPVGQLQVVTREVVAATRSSKTRERSEHHGTTSSGAPLGEAGQHAALTREIVALANTESGGRNDQLNRSVFALAQIVAGGGLSRGLVYDAVEEACKQNSLIADKGHAAFRKSFESGWSAGHGQSRTLADGPGVSGFDARLVDLSTWFKEDHPIPERFGMGGILYEEGLHWIAGEPESGKSVLAYQWALDAIEAGKRVLIVDEEAGERDALGKLSALEPRTDRWESRLDYLPPSGWDLRVNAARFHQFVLDRGVSMVVIDSASTVLGAAGLDENSNTDVTSFIKTVLIPLAKEHDLCVVVVDHKTKSAVDSRYARGASAKLGLVDFQISVSASPAFSRDTNGALKLTCDKDRFGVHGRGHQWRVDVAVGDGKILPHAIDLGTGKGAGAPDLGTPEPLVILAQAVVAKMGRPMSKTKIRDAVKAQAKVGSTKAHSAVDEAIHLGLLVRADDGENWVPAPNGNGARNV